MDDIITDHGSHELVGPMQTELGDRVVKRTNPFLAGFAIFYSILIVVVVLLVIIILRFLKAGFAELSGVLG
ncbi:MAG: hypothetical protein KKG59_07275 [Nanoarchaeota archaeon]|nr:hypothetical protein [Nanoarchaeota archaeon]